MSLILHLVGVPLLCFSCYMLGSIRELDNLIKLVEKNIEHANKGSTMGTKVREALYSRRGSR